MGRIHFSKNNFGFTLIELIVVVGIIGILSGGILITFNPAERIGQANDARRKTDLKQIQNALETYYNDFGSYPASLTFGGSFVNGTVTYMGKVPNDPKFNAKKYSYCRPSGQYYYLYASLDGQGNIASPSAAAVCPASSCTATCNYGVSSPNTSP